VTSTRPLHVDTDCGVDDALALVLLARSGTAIQSVSSVFGNTWADQAALNARLVLRQSGCGADVYVGAGVSLAARASAREQRGHGRDGLNGEGASNRRTLPILRSANDLNRISLAARSGWGGVFLGPLTNLAHALLDDPKAFKDWRPVVLAGAFDVRGRGADGADFNTWSDPEAFQRVLRTGIRPRLVPLDITCRYLFPTEKLVRADRSHRSPLMSRLARALVPYDAFHHNIWGGEGCRPHDLVAASAYLWPDLFRFEPRALDIDPTRQGYIVNSAGISNAEVCVGCEFEELATRIEAHLLA
jgi:inosine-uridine nucleoside N-ribohydrolase